MQQFFLAVKGLIQFNGKTLIVQRSDYVQEAAGAWEFPGGRMEFKEDVHAALKREIKEETGLDAEVGRILYASSFFRDEDERVVILCYQCKVSSDKVTLSNEHVNFLWADKARLVMLLDRGILDALRDNKVLELI